MGKKIRRKFVFTCVVLLLVFAFVFSGLQLLKSAAFFYQNEDIPVKTKTITRDGVKYFPRQDITVVMLLGVGDWGEVTSTKPNESRAVDMITLMIFDEKNEETTLLSLNRDTMLKMHQLDENGLRNGWAFQQLALSHVYGTGMEDSCENTRAAVSDFLGGVVIDHYVSITLDAIAIMNDAVGGVTVTVKDDFSGLDPDITMGEYTLRGKQAVTYVQSRKGVGDTLNVSRMERHKEYLNGFLPALKSKNKESDTFALSCYEKIAPYIVTDCSVNTLTSMMQRYADYTIGQHVTPAGSNVEGEEFYEFYADEEKLQELVLQLFYAPK